MWKTFVIYLVLFLSISTYAQKPNNDSLADFDYLHFNEHLSELKDNASKENYLQTVQRNFIKRKYNLVSEKIFESSSVATSTCGNIDFEDGSTAGWTITGDFKVMSAGLDPFGNFPVVCPGGNFSLRLNDNNTSCSNPNKKVNFKASAINTLLITSSNSTVKVNFAGATLAFPHPQTAAAYIKIEFLDINNNPISVPTFSTMYTSPPNSVTATSPITYSNSTLQGAQICSSVGNYPVAYMPWQTQLFNLSSYIGQTVKIKLIADWCLYDYDWAYAYFDVCCDSTCPIIKSPTIFNTVTKNICTNSTLNTTLCSSTGTNINYNWYNSMGPMATGSCVTVNSQDSYTLQSVSPTNTLVINQEVFNLGLKVPVSFSVSSNAACSNSSSGITLFVSPAGGVFGGTGISGSVFQPWVAGNGSHLLNYTYTNPIGGCVTTAIQVINVSTCTDVIEKLKHSQFSLAPNPFTSEVLINCNELPENSEFILFNTLGQEILRKQLTDGKNSIETSALPPGLYIYSLLSQNKQVKQGKLVKE